MAIVCVQRPPGARCHLCPDLVLRQVLTGTLYLSVLSPLLSIVYWTGDANKAVAGLVVRSTPPERALLPHPPSWPFPPFTIRPRA